MGLFTPLGLDTAKGILSGYGIDVATVEPLEAGSVNSNFRLRAADGARYFARIYEEQGEAGARAELRLLSELRARGIPVASALPAPGGQLPVVAGKPFAIYPWIEGDILCQARVSAEHAGAVGRALAELHRASASLSAIPEGRFGVEDLRARLDRIDRDARDHAETTALIRQRLDAYAGRRASLPSGIIHGDLFRDNVLWQGGRIAALLDFESASRGHFAYDLGVCLMAWCYGEAFDAALVGAMLDGYQRVRPLSEPEKAGLAGEAAIGALRFATTRITDFSMRAAPGEPPKRSHGRFLDRLRAIEAGALDAAVGIR